MNGIMWFSLHDCRESLENVTSGDYIRSLKDLPMATFETTIWEAFGKYHIYYQSDRQVVNIEFKWRINWFLWCSSFFL